MGWFKRAMGLEAPTNNQTSTDGPLGLAVGKSVSFDGTLKLLLEGHTQVVIPDAQQVWSRGEIELGQGAKLWRFYLEGEDFWLQVHTSGEHVESVILFNYLDSVVVNSDAELTRLAGRDSAIGLPIYTLDDGCEYQREWGSESGQTELVTFSERVVNAEQSYSVEHRSMLYARDTGLTERREFLVFSVEQDAEDAVSLTTSLGISLYSTDVHVL